MNSQIELMFPKEFDEKKIIFVSFYVALLNYFLVYANDKYEKKNGHSTLVKSIIK